jgi:hypothetical protein
MIWLPEAKPPPTWVPNQTDATVKGRAPGILGAPRRVVAHACFPPILFPLCVWIFQIQNASLKTF